MTRRTRERLGARSSYLPALLLLFAGSGCAALIYQVVWLQLLQLVIGSSAVSLSVLLATFMGGMCVGSLALPRLIAVHQHPLKVYAYLELGIAVTGLALLFGMPLVNNVYAQTGGGVLFRAVMAGICLLPPTFMMGATLPAIARWVETTPAGVSWLGLFYGGNIGGAVLGTLLAGFYLLRVFDVAIATFTAVAINAAVAVVSLQLAGRVPHTPPVPGKPPLEAGESDGRAERRRRALRESPTADRQNQGRAGQHPIRSGSAAGAVHLAIALSGFTALAAEVVWTRLLSLTVGATVYAFSLILAVFLFGLGIGSSLGAALARRSARPRTALAMCQMLLCGAIAWAAYLLMESLPFSPMTPSSDPWVSLRADMLRCVYVVLPGATLWGASFPLALAAAARPDQDPGRLVGSIYAANTVGAIAGSSAGLLIAAHAGSHRVLQVLIALSVISGALLLASSTAFTARPTRRPRLAVALFVAIAAAATLAWRIAPVPGVLIAYGRNSASWAGLTNVVHAAEGLNAFVAVSRTGSGAPIYHAAGKVQASSEGEDMRLQRMLAHLSHLIPEHPRKVLVIGLGAGITAGAIAIAPGVERVTIVEIERLVPPLSTYFSDYNYGVIDNPKVTVRIDDARHFLLTTEEKFDVITSDLVDPWVKGTAALFTLEFFDTVKRHLNPGGIATMFVQLYMSNMETVKSEIGTFMEVFPNTMVWGNTLEGRGYDLVLSGSMEPLPIDVDGMQARLDSAEYAEVAQSLREIGIGSAVELLSTYAGSNGDLRSWLSDAVINRDRNLRLQYLAGMGVDLQQSGPIYADMVRHARFPEHRFTGSPFSVRALREAVQRAIARAAGAAGAHP